MKKDKLMHLLGGILITAIIYQFNLELLSKVFVSLSLVFVLSVLKEIYDVYKPKPTGFDMQDILAALFGSLIMIFIL